MKCARGKCKREAIEGGTMCQPCDDHERGRCDCNAPPWGTVERLTFDTTANLTPGRHGVTIFHKKDDDE